MAYQDGVLADGATHYWRLGEASGPFVDLVGAAPGTLTAGTIDRAVPGAVAGDPALHIAYNVGQGAYVTLPSVTLPVPGSLEVWVKAPPSGAVTQMIWTNRSGTITTNTICDLAAGVPEWGASAGTIIGTHRVDDGLWHHLVATNDGTTLLLFVDGVLDKTRVFTLPATTGPAAIGWDNFLSVAVDLTVDEVAMYATVLTPAKIAAHYAAATAVASTARRISFGMWRQILP